MIQWTTDVTENKKLKSCAPLNHPHQVPHQLTHTKPLRGVSHVHKIPIDIKKIIAVALVVAAFKND